MPTKPEVPTALPHSDDPIAPVKSSPFATLTEDWWAVLIGSVVIGGVLLAAAFFLNGEKFPAPVYAWANAADLTGKVFAPANLALLAGIGLVFLALSGLAIQAAGGSFSRYATGFGLIFLLAFVSLVLAGNKTINGLGIEYVVFALLIGLAIGNLTAVPVWLREAARSEFFIKTGLVILGTSVLFTDIIKAGIPGLLQSVLVVLVVWFFALWLARRLKVDDEFGVILASAVAICGVSAAIVASGAIGGDKKKLSYITTLVLLVALPMMVLQPWAVRYFGIPEVVGGAWLGGTLDTTASVTAAAALVGPLALKAGVIVKFSQNVLIGFAAFFIAIWWTFKKNPSGNPTGEKPSLGVVWERFPKFVLGFIGASLLFSFLIPGDVVKQVGSGLNALRTVWFALAFVAIGLEARFADLVKLEGGKPALAFIGAQAFNIIWTLIWAYLLFGGILFPAPDLGQ